MTSSKCPEIPYQPWVKARVSWCMPPSSKVQVPYIQIHPVGWDELRWYVDFEGLPWETWKTHKLILAEWRNAAAKITTTNALVAMLSCVKFSPKNQFSNTCLGKVLLLLGGSLESCWVIMLQPSNGQSLRFLLKWMHCSYCVSASLITHYLV